MIPSMNSDQPKSTVTPAPILPSRCWTSERLEIKSWFEKNAPSLSPVYEGTVLLMYENRLPGRLHFISHAVREIRNRLPDVISGVEKTSRLEYTNELDGLAKEFRAAGLPIDRSMPVRQTGGLEQPSSSPGVSVPIPIYNKVADLIKRHEDVRETKREAANRLFEALSLGSQRDKEAVAPIVGHWIDVTDWFVRRTHVGTNVADEDGLSEHFLIFETTLSALIRSFFTTLDEIDEILQLPKETPSEGIPK